MTRQARSLMKHSDRTYRGGSFFPSGPSKKVRGPKPPHGIPDYTYPMASQKIDQNSTAIAVTNSASETTVATLLVPALTIRNQGATRLTASGTVTNSTNTGGTVTFRLKASDGTAVTVLATTAVACSTSANQRTWTLDEIMLGNDTNVQTHWGEFDLSAASTGTLAPSTFTGVGSSTSGLDEASQITFTVTAKMSVGSTGFTVTRESAVLEAVV